MGDKKTLILERQKRGQISKEEIESFSESPVEELLKLLNSNEPKERTIGSTLIGKKKYVDLILPLCTALQKEESFIPELPYQKH